jgi:transcription elongation factor Elf1
MRELYQCAGCGWLTTIYCLLKWTGNGLLCKNCLKRQVKEGASHD